MEVREAKESRETKVLKTSQVRKILPQVLREYRGRKTLKEWRKIRKWIRAMLPHTLSSWKCDLSSVHEAMRPGCSDKKGNPRQTTMWKCQFKSLYSRKIIYLESWWFKGKGRVKKHQWWVVSNLLSIVLKYVLIFFNFFNQFPYIDKHLKIWGSKMNLYYLLKFYNAWFLLFSMTWVIFNLHIDCV